MAITINGTTGITTTGDYDAEDGDKILLGTGDDLQIHHTSNKNYINAQNYNLAIQRGGTTSLEFDGNGDISIPDSKTLYFGNGADLNIYHDGSHSYIKDSGGTGNLRVQTNNLRIENAAGTENQALFTEDGSVELYYDNSKKFETTSAGATFSGSVLINNSSGVNVYGSISMTETSTYGWVKSFSGKGLYLVPTSNGVYLDSGNTSWNSGSDERTKTGLTPITDALTKIEGCRSVIGRYKTDEETTERSFLIAQDFQTHFPVAVGKNKTLPDDENLSLRYQDVIPLLLAGIKELSAEVKTLKTKVAALEAA